MQEFNYILVFYQLVMFKSKQLVCTVLKSGILCGTSNTKRLGKLHICHLWGIVYGNY